MIISSLSNKYLKLSSASIASFLTNLSDYTSVKVVGTFNCAEPTQLDNLVNSFDTNSWKFDLADSVAESQIASKLIIVNNATGKEFNVLTTQIDLGYVLDNCSVAPCLISNYSSYFAPLFKDQIDTFFTDNLIACNVTITFVNNVMYIADLPATFSFKELSYVSSALPEPAMYGDANSSTSGFFIASDGIYVLPSLFSKSAYEDGVYNITLKLIKEDGFILESNCYFLDINTKCRVAAYLVNILEETKVKDEDVSSIVHLLHYGLTNGGNCGCNCEEMCYIYKELDTMLTAFNPQTDTNCGC